LIRPGIGWLFRPQPFDQVINLGNFEANYTDVKISIQLD
jgi:hypothetical protein